MQPLLLKLNEDSDINLDIVATGTHLDPIFGNTVDDITKAGLNVVKRVPSLNTGKPKDVVRSLALISDGLADLLEQKSYDMVLILGDRQEMLPVANAALVFNIPVAHFHGGEITEGNYDDSIRHAISKMSTIHFSTCDEYSNRIIQLGEQDDCIYNIGSMAVDSINNSVFPNFDVIREKYQLPFDSKDYMVVLYHPVTLNSLEETKQELLDFTKALEESAQNFVLIGSNADVNSNFIRESFEKLGTSNRFFQVSSLLQDEYFTLIRNSKGLVGNSSSGIIEVNSLKVPVLNIGDRQKGRIHGPGVIDVTTDQKEILEGIKSLSKIKDFKNPYDKANSIQNAYSIIKDTLSNPKKRKIFNDYK